MSGAPESNHGSSRAVPSCYPNTLNGTSLAGKFRDLDDREEFAECRQRLLNETTNNFLVDFGADEVWSAFDLDDFEFSALLEAPKPFETRWINIWAPEHQKGIVKVLTTHYGISTRLRALMGSDPSDVREFKPVSPKLSSNPEPGNDDEDEDEDEKLPSDEINQLEGGYHPNLSRAPTSGSGPVELAASGLSSISFSQIVNQIWHFVSVDFGPRYICLGYNSVYAIPGVDFKNPSALPEGKRVWSWLILCDDGTIITIQENPFPYPERFKPRERSKSLAVIRRNTNLVFSGLSRLHSSSRRGNPLVTTQVRNFPDSPETATVAPGEGPSLLFFYLFDDWISSYSLVIKKEHSYSTALDKLRKKMLKRSQVGLIDDLHRLGRQLGVLKRLYQSYELILTRVIKQQRRRREENNRNVPANLQGSGILDFASRQDTWKTVAYDDSDPASTGGVELSAAAFSRFERLADRIRLYALSEIEECLTEKEALTFLVFNLIAMKDSQAVERLTRITILLAKVTILFLPVSLTTAYFSTEVKDLQNYTPKHYWITFAVVMCLSFVLLVLFGWLSGTMEGRPIYQSIAQRFYDASSRALGRTRRKGSRSQNEEE